ncbi:11084_t:CDS:2, partial [Entrophospora sp. SA101]
INHMGERLELSSGTDLPTERLLNGAAPSLENLPNGWRCVVKLNNGKLCNQFFSLTVTKGSTTNTIHHLQKMHGIVRKDIASKILENNESLIHNMIPPLTD